MKWTTSLLLLACAAPAYCADTNNLLSLLPPNANVVFGAHIRAVLDSTLARGIVSQMHLTSAELPKVVPVFGFDPLTDLDEVIFASSEDVQNPPMLVVAHGKFDMAHLTAKGKLYHGVRLIVTETKDEETGFAFLDASTVMMGDLAEVKTAIDRRVSPKEFDQVRWAQLAAYRDKFAIWGFADRPADLTKRLPSYTATPTLEAINRIQFGVGLAKGLEITAELHPRSADDVAQLTDALKLLETMVKASRPTLDDGTKIGIETTDDGTMRLSLEVSDEQLLKAMQNPKPAEVAVTASTEPVHKTETAERKVRAPAPMPVDHSHEGGTSVFTLPGHK
jgi:hypothetical protein